MDEIREGRENEKRESKGGRLEKLATVPQTKLDTFNIFPLMLYTELQVLNTISCVHSRVLA